MSRIHVNRKREKFFHNPEKVVAKFFNVGDAERKSRIINRILNLPEKEINRKLYEVLTDFDDRHYNIENVFLKNFHRVKDLHPSLKKVSQNQKLLIGSYFTHEYSIEAAALFNPSIITHPDQQDLKDGELRIILSFRATGEGHISSIVFRSGIVDKRNRFTFDHSSPYVELPEILLQKYHIKEKFIHKSIELGINERIAEEIFNKLPDSFNYIDLETTIDETYDLFPFDVQSLKSLKLFDFVIHSNFDIKFREESNISERVIFPVSEQDSRGIEDARFVKFFDESESCYYATYTAYDGVTIRPMLLKTKDFLTFHITPIKGKFVKGKNFALFPRKISDKYFMIGRQDGESLYLMSSDNVSTWDNLQKFYEPKYPWEMIQVGNSGSPLETPEGWIVLTHGVGPVRKYCIGAILLDLDDPRKVIGELKWPLMKPNILERDGYVPNVLYTCGALIHHNNIILPYAASDQVSGIAIVSLSDLISSLLANS